MKHEIIDGVDRYTADDGKGFIRNGDSGVVDSTELCLPKTDSIKNFSELPLGTVVEPAKDVRYYAVDLLAAIGEVCGDERYDAIKAALSATRIKGAPVWDMLVSGMFIPATDPRLAMIRNALVEAELVTGEEFDRILAMAASDEPVPESGAAEG